MTIFNRLNQILLIVTSLIVAVLLALGVWTYQNRNRLLADGLAQVERAASEAIGVPLKVGRVTGPFWGGVSLRDVRVYGSDAPDAPVIAFAPEVRASYSILEILKLGDKPVQVEVFGARVTLARDAKGNLTYQPKFKPSTGEPWEPPVLPPIQIMAHGGTVQWTDHFQRKAPFEASLKGISARADLVNSVLTFSGNGKEVTSPLQVKGHYRLKGGSGAVKAEISRIDVPRWVTYLAPSQDWWATRGLADAQVDVTWQDPAKIETLAVNGKVQVQDGQLEVRNLLRPVQAITAEARFDLKDVTLERVEARLQGNLITGGGKVLGIDKPWVPNSKKTGPTLDMAYTARGVDLASLSPLVEDLDQYELSGVGEVQATVSGFAADPVVTADLQVPQARIVKQELSNFRGQLRYQDMVVTLPGWNGTVHGGQVDGATTLRFGKGKPGTPEGDMRIETSASWHGVNLAALLTPYLDAPLPLKGAASGSVVVSGPATHLDIRGRAEVLNGAYADQHVERVAGAFHLSGKAWDVPEAIVQVAGGQLTATAKGNDAGSVTGRFALADFPLDRLEAMGVSIPMAGVVAAEGVIGGNAQVPESIRVSGKAQGARLIIDGQEITDALLRWSFAGKRLDLPVVEGKTAGGEVAGNGHLMLPEKATAIPDFSFDVAVKNVEAGDIEPLQRVLVEQLGMVRGVMTMSAHLESQNQDLKVRGDVDAKKVEAERFGDLERVWGPIYFGHDRLTMPELRAKPELGSQGDDAEFVVKGDLDFSRLRQDPNGDLVANLTVTTIDANLRQIMEAVHWQQLLRGTWIGRRMINETLGPGTPAGDLPGREDQPLMNGALPTSFAPLLDHWKEAKKEPLPSNELFLASRRPFWQAFEGRLSMDYEITGPLSDPDMKLRAHVRHGKAYGHQLETAQVSLTLKGDRLVVPYLSISSTDGGSVYAKGMMGPGQELVVYGDRLDLAWINPWLQVQELTLGGRMGVTVRAKGTLSDPHVDLFAEVNKGLLNEFAYDQARATAIYTQGRLNIKSSEIVKDGRAAHITGSLPLPATPGKDAISMDMDLDGESLGLVSVFTKGEVEWLGGPGSVKLALRGTVEEPKLTGSMDLLGGSIGIKALDGPLTNVVASASIGPKGVLLQRATAQYGGGKIVASGNLTMTQEFKPQDMRFQVSVSQVDLKLKNKLYSGMTGATLEVTGKPEHPVISGIIALSRGTVQLPSGEEAEASASDEMIPVTLKDLTVQLGTGVQVSMGSALTDRATMKLDVTVVGNLLVNGMLDDPQPKGVILVRSGSFTTVNTDFRIVSDPVGRVEFLGGGLAAEADDFMDILAPTGTGLGGKSKALNARLDVTAQARVWDYNGEDFRALKGKAEADYLNVIAHVTGTLKNMEITFESNPPLSQDRILQVLGKESLITSTFRGTPDGPQAGDILRREVTEFISSGVGQFFNTAIDDWLAETGSKRFIDELRMDLVSGVQAEEMAPEMLPNLSLYGQTRPLGPLSLNARYTFRGNQHGSAQANGFQDYYQVGINYRLNSIWSLQAGLDNGLPGLGQLPPLLDLKIDGVSVNVPITLKAQLRF